MQRILVTGSSGFIGSHLGLALSRLGHEVVGLDQRPPSIPNVRSIQADANCWALSSQEQFDTVVHLAAYWSYEITPSCWQSAQRNNVDMTKSLWDFAKRTGAKRFVFASSLEAVNLQGIISEATEPTQSRHHPYAWSKSASEQFFARQADGPATSIVRLSGVFSDWCELPPLAWLFDRWSSRWPTGHVIAGRGVTGMPYLHVGDVCAALRNVIEGEPRKQTLMVMPSKTSRHIDLFPPIRQGLGLSAWHLSLPVACVAPAMRMEKLFWKTPEQPWMLKLIDQPIQVDQSKTELLINWTPSPALSLEAKLPELLERFRQPEWRVRQANRAAHSYVY